MTKIAFVMDPLDSLALKKDSTLAMLRACQQRGLEIYYLLQSDLMLWEGEVHGMLNQITLRADFCDNLDYTRAGDDWFQLGGVQRRPMAEMDIIMMRGARGSTGGAVVCSWPLTTMVASSSPVAWHNM
ncbi:MAG: hypothetical protein AAF993_05620 [Pseudomonadota bacterium]